MFVLRSTYQKQLNKNAELIEDRDSLRTKLLNALHATDEHINRNSNFAIDFNQLNPFSIERNIDCDNKPVTVLGYFDVEGKPSEWYLYCSLERHNQFVEEFNQHKARKNHE